MTLYQTLSDFWLFSSLSDEPKIKTLVGKDSSSIPLPQQSQITYKSVIQHFDRPPIMMEEIKFIMKVHWWLKAYTWSGSA